MALSELISHIKHWSCCVKERNSLLAHNFLSTKVKLEFYRKVRKHKHTLCSHVLLIQNVTVRTCLELLSLMKDTWRDLSPSRLTTFSRPVYLLNLQLYDKKTCTDLNNIVSILALCILPYLRRYFSKEHLQDRRLHVSATRGKLFSVRNPVSQSYLNFLSAAFMDSRKPENSSSPFFLLVKTYPVGYYMNAYNIVSV